MNKTLLSDPYQLSFLRDDDWIHFTIVREVYVHDESNSACFVDVYEGKTVAPECKRMQAVMDVPTDIHDTEEIIDILNDYYQLGLY
jgi:hypothetical protein